MHHHTSKIYRVNGRAIGIRNCSGKEIDIGDMVAKWYDGPTRFNLFFVDFNGMFGNLVEDTIDPIYRIKINAQDLVVLAFESDETSMLLNQLVEVVNFSSRPVVAPERKDRYSQILAKIAEKINEYHNDYGVKEPDLTIVPMKGGSYFLNFLEKSRIHKNALAIECKRIQMAKEKSFCFGMALNPADEYPLNKSDKPLSFLTKGKKIRIVELCVVSGMTTIGFLLYLKENKIKPEIVEVNTIAMSQQGYEEIRNFAKEMGFKVKFVTGGMYYRLGNYYFSRRDELLTLEGKSVIGDIRSFLD